MWLGFPAVLLFVLLLIGGIIGGGVFTIVLVPVAFVVAIAAVTFAVWSRAQQGSGGRSHAAQTGDPLPHSEHHNVAASPNAPGDLVDARRHQQ